jgi:23S rRNA (adenine2503-C2)-methyltransferase
MTDTNTFTFFEMTPPELKAVVDSRGHKPFRAKQLCEWVYDKMVTDPAAMSNVPNAMTDEFTFLTSSIVERADSEDGTMKLLLELADGELIECVSIPTAKRHTVCLSTQVGCGMGCAFCASGEGGLKRNLTGGEIIEQIVHLAQAAERKVTHVVLMGMGEPLANYDNTVWAIEAMVDPRRFDLSARHITLSTIGLPKAIEKLSREDLPITLAVSLHAPNETLRRKIMPASHTITVAEVIKAAKHFFEARGRQVTIEYVVLGGLNDSKTCAEQLVRALRPLQCHINLIPFNAEESDLFRKPTQVAVLAFARMLEKAGMNVTIRKSRGGDIAAACGQLRRRHQRDT